MKNYQSKNGVSIRAHKGDAMTLLAFDVAQELKENLAGFTIRYKFKKDGKWQNPYVYNRLTFSKEFIKNNSSIKKEDRNSTLYAPIQKFNWVHVPNTDINTKEPVFGLYTYEITPRYILDGQLLPLDNKYSVKVNIEVKPFEAKKTKIGFTRGFVSSVAYAKRFNVKNNNVRPKTGDTLLFDIKQIAGKAKRWNDEKKKYEEVAYTFEEQHQWLGWQARQRILDFLKEAVSNKSISLKAFAFDLNEPEICKRLLKIASDNRLQIILDNSATHNTEKDWENIFENEFKKVSSAENIKRGHFISLAHSKVFIQLKKGKAQKVLTGSTNFSTNGLYVNSNHVLVFNNKKVTQLYSDVFDQSFGEENMKKFKGSEYTITDHEFSNDGLPQMTITFAPHAKSDADRIFKRINERILQNDNTDVLFAIMKDTSKSAILDAIKQQVKSDKVFTYGITDTISSNSEYGVFLYKPNSKRGIRIAAKGVQNLLPMPFGKVAGIDGIAIHHKFVVVNFKGKDPVVFCGSSNLAYDPEQKNGDNLLEIHDKDIVTAFAIEALRLVDHFHWRNNELKLDKEMQLDDLSDKNNKWYTAWFKDNDLKCTQRKLYIKE